MRTPRGFWTVLALAACGPGDDEPPATPPPPDPVPTCATPRWEVPYAAAGASPVRVGVRRLPDDAPGTHLELRPVVLTAAGRGGLTVTLEGPFRAFDADGGALPAPLEVASDALPLTLLIGADREGAGHLRATPWDGHLGCADTALPLGTVAHHDLAARRLPAHPHAHHVDLFREDEGVEVAVDPGLHDDRVGLPFDVYVLPHRSPEAWAADPTLHREPLASRRLPASLPDAVIPVGSPGAGAGHPTPYDVVLDFGRDGRLDPGDLIDGLDQAGFWVAGDLSAPGPYAPSVGLVAREPELEVEVWWPTDLPPALRPAPLVVIAHGNGHHHTWYGHLGHHLASWGFVVASHRNNTAPGVLTASTSTLRSTDFLVAERDALLDGRLRGLLDPTRIAWVGHSRGGEGVVRAWQRLLGHAEAAPVSSFHAGHVKALVAIAPTVFDGVRLANPGDAPFLLLAGAADGDVTGGVDCDTCQYLRIPAAASGPVGVIYVHGASHNVFHDGGADSADDGVGPERVGPEVVHPATQAWLLAFLGWHVLEEPAYREVLTRAPSAFRPVGVSPGLTLSQTWREAISADVLVVDDFQEHPEPERASGGGRVRLDGVEALEHLLDDRDQQLRWHEDEPLNGMTLVAGDGYERGAVLAWSGEAAWTVELPAPTDVLRWQALSLAVTQTTRHPLTEALGGPLTFTVELTDADGHRSRVSTAPFAAAPPPYPREGLGPGVGWSNEWSTFRIPLRAFVADGRPLDLARVTEVTLRFGEAHGAPVGRIGLDDVMFVP